MPAPALMRIRFSIEASTWPSAASQLISKMAAVCPAHPFEVVSLIADPAPGGTPPRTVGPPWRFTIEVQLTTLI